MAATDTKKSKLTAASLREMKQDARRELLTDNRTELLEAKRSLRAGELTNPRKVKNLRRTVALILTVENEPTAQEHGQSQKEEA